MWKLKEQTMVKIPNGIVDFQCVDFNGKTSKKVSKPQPNRV